jgi:exopolysaccharide biosynthesis WecB/TagA/CpsF family protein
LTTLDQPEKHDLLGVHVSSTTYEEAVEFIISAARGNRGGTVTCLPVHGIVTASRDPFLGSKINTFNIVTPDGQPVRWALNLLYDAGMMDRVYGPELMLRVCRRAAMQNIPIYLFGSHPSVLEKLRDNLVKTYPSLRIVGVESPPFRDLSAVEDQEVVERINGSGAKVVFLGLGCPKQDLFAYDHRASISGVQVCVGAAFDFLSHNKKMAPKWMQNHGLEWLYRFSQEPQRLWKRYLVTNAWYAGKVLHQIVRTKLFRSPTQ